jgi:hypothetical protein
MLNFMLTVVVARDPGLDKSSADGSTCVVKDKHS